MTVWAAKRRGHYAVLFPPTASEIPTLRADSMPRPAPPNRPSRWFSRIFRSPTARRVVAGLFATIVTLLASLASPVQPAQGTTAQGQGDGAGTAAGTAAPEPSSRRGPLDPDDTAHFPRAGAYCGKDTCKDCHEDEWDLLVAAVHAPVLTDPKHKGCETCHGPGQKHADDEDNEPALITLPLALEPWQQTAVCGQCHSDMLRQHGGEPAGFIQANKACTDCHSVHEEIEAPPHPHLKLDAKVDVDAKAEPVGGEKCLQCHPVRDQLLSRSPHRSLRATEDPTGCEQCHGNGSLHVETNGLARLIARPDTARDGIETCRSCHQEVDAVEFHWRGKRSPLLSKGMRCTTCHSVHRPHHDTVPADWLGPRPAPGGARAERKARERAAAVDPHTGEDTAPSPTTQGSQATARPAATNGLCARCHEPAFGVLKGTIHASLGGRDLPLAEGCGGCHAGAEQHAYSGGRKALVDSLHATTAEHQRNTCGSCHDGNQHLRHVDVGSHQNHEVTCLTCHSPAAPIGKTRDDAEKRCANCHQEVAAQFRLPNHHPVHDGPMHCSDCHEPHGARPKLRNTQLTERACVQCHLEYRGPFVFAHQAGRSDGCIACHLPHGSSNRRMMRHAIPQQSCLQCHANFPAFHDQSPGSLFRNCLNCHTEIHGSNHSRFFFR